MKKKKNIVLCLALLILITLSLIIYFGFGNNPKTTIQTCSIIFIVITELVIFCNAFLMLNKKLNTFEVAGLCSTTFIYTICSLLFNILLINIFTSNEKILILNFSMLLIYLFIDSIIVLFKKED